MIKIYLRVTLFKQVKYFYDINFKPWKKEKYQKMERSPVLMNQ